MKVMVCKTVGKPLALYLKGDLIPVKIKESKDSKGWKDVKRLGYIELPIINPRKPDPKIIRHLKAKIRKTNFDDIEKEIFYRMIDEFEF